VSDVAAAAAWMRDHVQKHGSLYQEQAAGELSARFGDECVRMNDGGNLAIAPAVLREFRTLTEGTVVWDRAERAWRRREAFDSPGRLADT